MDEKAYTKEVYKYWFKSQVSQGFLGLTPWLEAGKIKIDIGSLENDGLKGSTHVWCNILDLHTYLHSVVYGTAPTLYAKNEKNFRDTDESYSYFGGSASGDSPVSRVLKIHYWSSKEREDTNAFAWKTAHFKGRVVGTGAILPDMKSLLSVNMIKIPRVEMHKIFHSVDLALQSHVIRSAVNGKDWWDWKSKDE